jgi:hypothetical protein
VVALFLFLLSLYFTVFPVRAGTLRASCLLLYFLVRGITEAAPMNSLVEFSTFGFWFSIWLLVPSPSLRTRPVREAVARADSNPVMRRGWQSS